jgi:glycosyltransferase involved in cell wall biosynthesis
MASSMAGSTNAKGLEEMTVSMLMGENGKQQEELERLASWLSDNCKPDVVHISNALLLGLAHRIKEKLNVPIVCSLQDEDVWVDAMKPAFRDNVWNLMSEKAKDVDRFIAVSDFFSGVMQRRMNLSPERVLSLYLGVDPGDYEFVPTSFKGRNIGYISRICHENGFDILVDAFVLLKKMNGFGDVKLIITGGYTGADTSYIKEVRKKLYREKLEDQAEFPENFDETGRKDFFKKVSVISVPVRNGEAFGMYLLESMASGIPVVQPDLGAFPEIVNLAGGGIIYETNTPEALCQALAGLLSDPEKLDALSHMGRKGVEAYFNIHNQAKEMIEVYKNMR